MKTTLEIGKQAYMSGGDPGKITRTFFGGKIAIIESYDKKNTEIRQDAFDILFQDELTCMSKGYSESYEYCYHYIASHRNNKDYSYYDAYRTTDKHNLVQIISVVTSDVIYEEFI